MRSHLAKSIVLSLALLSVSVGPRLDTERHASTYGSTAMSAGDVFSLEANVGQFAPDVRFVGRASGYAAVLSDDSLTVAAARATTADDRLHWRFAGRPSRPEAESPTATVSHYFLGRDPASWRTSVPHYERVRYRDVFPGIDVVFRGHQANLEFDFEIAPGADPKAVALRFDRGTALTLTPAGDLDVARGLTHLRQLKPLAFQTTRDGRRREVTAGYLVGADDTIGFDLGDFDPTLPLVIDPTLVYSTYIGGTAIEFTSVDPIASVKADATGAVYLAGETASTNLYGQATALSGTNVFVTKLNAAGSAIDFTTFIGGSLVDDHASLTLDASGNVYLSGRTTSTDLPVTGAAFQTTLGGGADAFVAKLTPTGTLTYLTYLGGTGTESPEGIAVNAAGNALVTGKTDSDNFPTASPFQSARGSATASDAFVTKLKTDGSGVIFSTYLGGLGLDVAFSVVVDNLDNVYLGGRTASSNFPVTPGAFSRTLTGAEDIFVVKMSASGSTITYGTYLGGTENATGVGAENGRIAVDAAGNVYVSGYSNATDFPAGAASPVPQSSRAGGYDAIVAKLNASGSSLLYRTYLGGISDDLATAMDLDQYGNLYVTGVTASSGFPTAGTAWDTTFGAPTEVFVTKIKSDGTALRYSSFLGGSGAETGLAIDVDGPGNVYVTGLVTSPDFPLASAFDSSIGGTQDAFVTKIKFQDDNSNNIPDDQEADSDGDGMPDLWETDHGLDPNSAVGNNGAAGDPDNDGSPNLQEYQNGTDPNQAVVRYFAEGATSTFFDDQIALANPNPTLTATVVLQFRTSGGVVKTFALSIQPLRRVTLNPKSLKDSSTGASLGLENAEFSTEIRTNVTVMSDRTMTWDANQYGAHAEASVEAPSSTWYLAEGATTGAFNLFYLIQNPNATAVTATVRYLLPGGTGPTIDYSVPANSRQTIWVNAVAGLEDVEVSAVITSPGGSPIIVERAMYMDRGTQQFAAGHDSAGVTSPSLNWFLAEGATGPFFELFILVENPNGTDANVRATFLKSDGTTVVRDYVVLANSRFNIWVDADSELANEGNGLSTTIASTNGVPIIVERSMWWPTCPPSGGACSSTNWYEAHNSPGTTQTGTQWGLAEGEVGNVGDKDTFILIANTSTFAGTARVTLLFEDGSSASEDVALLPASRRNVWVRSEFPTAAGKRFGALVQSLGGTPAQIVVERAMYSTALDAPGQTWSAGTNALALKLQ
ncbi:MAG: SBBP repeat-containing protein [Vicinamibacterales bacterium]